MKYINWYFSTYKGLSKEIWIMATTLLINRSGLMVMTFLSLYLIEAFDYSKAEAGFVVSFYGWGSIFGVWLGGFLAEKVGYLRIQILAMLVSGLVFISMYFCSEYFQFILLTFLVSATADTFRPANMASVPWFSSEENRTRSIALIRLAINLGISIGPAVGGFLAITLGYASLFWVDGITCIAAGIFMFSFLGIKDPNIRNGSNKELASEEIETVSSELITNEPDKASPKFWWLVISIFFWSFAFFQIIYGFTVFMKEDLLFDEFTIGLFYTLNGLIIFFIEMPVVQVLQKKKTVPILNVGIVLCAISFIFLFLGTPQLLLFPIGYILFITFGEIFYLPFTNTLALNYTPEKSRAKYMSYYSLAFSISHVLGPLLGLWLADKYGFQTLWVLCSLVMIVVFIMTQKLKD